MDVVGRSLYFRLVTEANLSNETASEVTCSPLLQNVNSGIPKVLGINLAVWLVRHVTSYR